jgi:hypothetical protein
VKAESEQGRYVVQVMQKIYSEFWLDTLSGREYWRDLGKAGGI